MPKLITYWPAYFKDIYTVSSMPNTKSAKRKVKKIQRQASINKLRRNRYKSAVKKMQKLIEKRDKNEIDKFFPIFQSELMKVAKTGVIKKQNLSRKISKISKRIRNITK